MSKVAVNERGGYRYIEGVFQYSGGVAAEPGYRIERAAFKRPVSLSEGFERIRKHLESLGRPMQALCACELRSPKPFNEESFAVFNRQYVDPLQLWDVLCDGKNPIARTNVCPIVDAPSTPSFFAFSYTVEANEDEQGGFVVAGSAEAPEGKGSYLEHTIRLGDQSPEGIHEKAVWVRQEMERRLSLLGFNWTDASAVGLYTKYNVHPFIQDTLVKHIGGTTNLVWHYSRPPVEYLDYEMDVRGISRELVI